MASHWSTMLNPLTMMMLLLGLCMCIMPHAKVFIHGMCKVPAKLFGVDHLIFLKRDRHVHGFLIPTLC